MIRPITSSPTPSLPQTSTDAPTEPGLATSLHGAGNVGVHGAERPAAPVPARPLDLPLTGVNGVPLPRDAGAALGSRFVTELLAGFAPAMTRHLATHLGPDGYQINFLQAGADGKLSVERGDLTPAHEAQILSRVCVCFNRLLNRDAATPDMGDIRARVLADLPLSPQQEQALLQQLYAMALQDDGGKPLYVNKLLRPAHFVLEFPGDAAIPRKDMQIAEPASNRYLVAQLGFPSHLLEREPGQHETYSLVAFVNDSGEAVNLGELFGGGLQGVMRVPVSNAGDRFAGYHDMARFASGGHAFDVAINENVVKNNAGKLGADMMNFAANVNLDNLGMPEMEGFTAGVSGNALHYVIQTAKYCQSTGRDFDFEQTLEVCRDHLVGDSIHQPVHHSLPEVMQGAYIGRMFVSNGILSGDTRQLSQSEVLPKLEEAVALANEKVMQLKAGVYRR